MAVRTAHPMDRRPALVAEQSRADTTHYELLNELARGRLGRVHLVRATSRNASRHVLLRQLPEDILLSLSHAVRRASSVMHPRWLKTLGLVTVEDSTYVASEYVAGLPLSELLKVMQTVDLSVVPEVALRIVLDSLHAASAARAALGFTDSNEACRYLYADSTWVATFGETLLMEPGVAQSAARCYLKGSNSLNWEAGLRPDGTWVSPEERRVGSSSQTSDVFAAGALLWELLSGRSLPVLRAGVDSAPAPRLDDVQRSGRRLLPPIVALVARALSPNPGARFTDVDDMADAIESLPARWLGTDAQVQAAIEPLVNLAAGKLDGDEIEQQLNSGQHPIDPWETPTRSMRAPSIADIEPKSTRPTLRPPRPGAA